MRLHYSVLTLHLSADKGIMFINKYCIYVHPNSCRCCQSGLYYKCERVKEIGKVKLKAAIKVACYYEIVVCTFLYGHIFV